MSDDVRRLIVSTIHDQEQEWTHGREWYRGEDQRDIIDFFHKVNDGTHQAVAAMSMEEVAVMCRLAVLALVEIANKELMENA